MTSKINRYPFRQTAERRSRNAEIEITQKKKTDDQSLVEENNDEFNSQTETETETDSGTESDFDTLSSDSEIDEMSATAVITPTTKFVGTVDENDPDKRKREAYTVDQYLADVDSRILARKITDPKEKIKEALLLVDPDKGDAHGLMTSSTFNAIRSYEELQRKCRLIWKPKAYKDKFYNLQQLRSPKKRGTDFSYMAELRTAIDRVLDDISKNNKFLVIAGGRSDNNIDARELLTYVTFGTMYDGLTEEYQKAFRKLTLDPKEDLVEVMGKIIEKASESRVRQEVVAYTDSQAPSTENKSEKVLVTQTSQHKGSGNNLQRGSFRGRGMQHSYRGNVYNKGNSQAYNYNNANNSGYSQRGYNASHRGRNYRNQGDRGKIECKRCGNNNHRTHECKYCEYCNRYGHLISHCYSKQRDEQKSQNKQQNKNN